MNRLPKKDVVIIGLGWTGSIVAQELTEEGLDVIALERGPWRDTPTDFAPGFASESLPSAAFLPARDTGLTLPPP